MRVCAVSLPELRIEVVREVGPECVNFPLAVVVAPAPMTEQDLLGNTRLSVVSREARALGILPGHTIAQARARAGDLAVRIVRPDAVRDVLARLAEVGLSFGATVSFGMEGDASDASSSFGDVVWIDVTGCAHLHAPRSSTSIFDGETILASRLASVIASLGHTCFVAIADGPRVAAMLARSAAEATLRALGGASRSRRSKNALADLEPIVVRPGENARAIASLPVASLPLATADVRWLAKLGVRTIEEMRALPREGLGSRLGVRAREVLSLVDGDDRAPLTPYVPPEVPEEETELEYGVEGTQALTFVTKTLTDRLSARLQGRAVAAARVELELRLDAAMLREAAARVSAAVSTNDPVDNEKVSTALVELDLPAPLSIASDLLAALRPKIERLVLSAPVLGAKLRAPVLVHKRVTPLSLFENRPKAERALPRLVAELVSDLGPDAVSLLVLGDGWIPEERSRLVNVGAASMGMSRAGEPMTPTASKSIRSPKKRRRLLSSVPEPTRLVADARPIAREGVRVTRHLSRLESVEWWKEAPMPAPQRHPSDFVQAWTDDGAAWIEIDRATGAMCVRGWFD